MRWQVRGIRADGKKLAFPVTADDIAGVMKIAQKKAKGGSVTDVVLVGEDKEKIRARAIRAARE